MSTRSDNIRNNSVQEINASSVDNTTNFRKTDNNKIGVSTDIIPRETSNMITRMEFIIVPLATMMFYMFILIPFIVFVYKSIFGLVHTGSTTWGFEGGLWDHPEPNYTVSVYIAEFYCCITAIPYAATLLIYQGIKHGYSKKVLVLYFMDLWMYTGAFISHSTLYPLLNSITVTSVIASALYTFIIYSWIAGGILKSLVVRVCIATFFFFTTVIQAFTLPPLLGQNGGIMSLFIIQTPPVIVALLGAYCVYSQNKDDKKKLDVYRPLVISAALLSLAMGLSLVEALYGKMSQEMYFGNFPALHISVHLSEQTGIYLYGMMTAALTHTVLSNEGNIDYIFGFIPSVRIQERGKRK